MEKIAETAKKNLKKNFFFQNFFFLEIFGQNLGPLWFAQINQKKFRKFLTPPLKIFLNPYPPPPGFLTVTMYVISMVIVFQFFLNIFLQKKSYQDEEDTLPQMCLYVEPLVSALSNVSSSLMSKPSSQSLPVSSSSPSPPCICPTSSPCICSSSLPPCICPTTTVCPVISTLPTSNCFHQATIAPPLPVTLDCIASFSTTTPIPPSPILAAKSGGKQKLLKLFMRWTKIIYWIGYSF